MPLLRPKSDTDSDSPISSLPAELVDRIINLVSDHKTLLQCTLVCQGWLPASRYTALSRRPVVILAGGRHTTLLALLDDDAHRATLTSFLSNVEFYSYFFHRGIASSDRSFTELAEAFKNSAIPLQRLKLGVTCDPHSPKLDSYGLIRMSFASLKSLEFSWAGPPDFQFDRTFFETLGACHALEEIGVQENIVFHEDVLNDFSLPSTPANIRRVSILLPHSRQTYGNLNFFLNWIFSTAPPSRMMQFHISAFTVNQPAYRYFRNTPGASLKLDALKIVYFTSMGHWDPFDLDHFTGLRTLDMTGHISSSGGWGNLLASISTLASRCPQLRHIALYSTDIATEPTLCTELDSLAYAFITQIPQRIAVSVGFRWRPPPWKFSVVPQAVMRLITPQPDPPTFPLCMDKLDRPFVADYQWDVFEFWEIRLDRVAGALEGPIASF